MAELTTNVGWLIVEPKECLRRHWFYVMWCGASPLVLGVSTFLMWLPTHFPGLAMIGVCTLFLGVFSSVIGAIFWFAYCWTGFRSDVLTRRQLCRRAVASAALLVVNYPVAFAIIVYVMHITGFNCITIANHSPHRLTDVRIVGARADVRVADVPPGDKVKSSFRCSGEGSLSLLAESEVKSIDEVMVSYVTNGLGVDVFVTVNADLAIKTVVSHQW